MSLILTPLRERRLAQRFFIRMTAGLWALSLLLSCGSVVAQTRTKPKAGTTSKARATGRTQALGVQGAAMKKTPTNILKSLRFAGIPTVDNDGRHTGVTRGVQIEVYSREGFPAVNNVWALWIGSQRFTNSRYPDDGDPNTLLFTLTQDEFDRTTTGDLVRVHKGVSGGGRGLAFGRLNKGMIK